MMYTAMACWLFSWSALLCIPYKLGARSHRNLNNAGVAHPLTASQDKPFCQLLKTEPLWNEWCSNILLYSFKFAMMAKFSRQLRLEWEFIIRLRAAWLALSSLNYSCELWSKQESCQWNDKLSLKSGLFLDTFPPFQLNWRFLSFGFIFCRFCLSFFSGSCLSFEILWLDFFFQNVKK